MRSVVGDLLPRFPVSISVNIDHLSVYQFVYARYTGLVLSMTPSCQMKCVLEYSSIQTSLGLFNFVSLVFHRFSLLKQHFLDIRAVYLCLYFTYILHPIVGVKSEGRSRIRDLIEPILVMIF